MTARKAGAIAGVAAAVLAFCVPVAAEPSGLPESLLLTPEQTLALYGTEILCSIRLDDTYDTPQTIQFDYAGTTDTVGFLNDGGGFGDSGSMQNTPTSDSAEWNATTKAYLCGAKYLVYKASASQWGGAVNYGLGEYRYGGDYALYSQNVPNYARPAEVHIPFSIALSSTEITSFRSAVMYSTWINQPPYFTTTWYQYNRCKLLTHGVSEQSDPIYSGIPGQSISGVANPYIMGMPTYAHESGAVDDSRMGYFSGFALNVSFPDDVPFTVTGMTVDALAVSSVLPSNSRDADIWLLVACPTLGIERLPAVTTTTRDPVLTGNTGLTGIGTTETGVDLTGIGVDLREIIMNQRHQIRQAEVLNENARIIANNTNTIVQQLNKIYEQMVKMGQVPVNGTDTQDMIAAVGSALGEYTTARIPNDATQGVRFWGAIVKYLYDDLGWAAGLAVFGLAMSLTCWILFRGRNA